MQTSKMIMFSLSFPFTYSYNDTRDLNYTQETSTQKIVNILFLLKEDWSNNDEDTWNKKRSMTKNAKLKQCAIIHSYKYLLNHNICRVVLYIAKKCKYNKEM